MFFKSNQQLNTVDTILVIVGIGLIIGIGISILNKPMHPDSVQSALQKAEILAHQIINHSDRWEKNSRQAEIEKRGIASVSGSSDDEFALTSRGYIGLDPWGQSYNYQIVEGENGKLMAVVVWSQGPNKHEDTIISENITVNSSITFAADDVGTIVRVQ